MDAAPYPPELANGLTMRWPASGLGTTRWSREVLEKLVGTFTWLDLSETAGVELRYRMKVVAARFVNGYDVEITLRPPDPGELGKGEIVTVAKDFTFESGFQVAAGTEVEVFAQVEDTIGVTFWEPSKHKGNPPIGHSFAARREDIRPLL